MKEFLYKVNFYNILIGFLILSVLNSVVGSILLDNVTYRMLSTFLAFAVFGIAFLNNQLKFIKGNLFVFYLVFVFLYFIRIFVDLFINNVTLSIFGNLYVFYFSVISYLVIFPLSVATIVNLNVIKLLNNTYYIYAIPFLVQSFITFSTSKFGLIEERETDFENVGLNSISMFAAIIAGWTFLRLLNSRFNIITKSFAGLVLMVVFYTLAVAATKSAFVALTVVLAIYLGVNYKALSNHRFVFSLSILFFVIVATSPFWISWFDLILQRFDYAIENRRTGREHIYSKAIDLFLDNPILGGSFVLPNEAYFHNSLLDAFVSTGFFGGMIFLIMNLIALKKCFSLLKIDSPYSFFAVGYIATFVISMFTSNLFSNYTYWSFLMCVIAISEQTKKKYEVNY